MNPRESTTWRLAGHSAAIEWGGSTWTLGFEAGRFGLRSEGVAGEYLTLRGLAAVGRRDDGAFTPASLVAIEVLHSRLLATFEPSGWNGLTVRAAWGPSRDGRGMDLEVQASTSTVGELLRLEVLVGSRGIGGDRAARPLLVAPRDRVVASLSYDGRETDDALSRLATLPISRNSPGVLGPAGYLEFVHPQDVSRTITDAAPGASNPGDVEYALFGYDLEKGVVLRGRLRGIWPEASAPDCAADERRRFLDEPPPLRTA
ncbi:hypothetical protein [Paludisphaera soli]|uniref:hypothetical protein n=1 Tax=Paludisphaera soli TaxID=2712865 RepID=UPI0013EC1DD2|nr:hypothetical protein [Paludisphaera soli]